MKDSNKGTKPRPFAVAIRDRYDDIYIHFYEAVDESDAATQARNAASVHEKDNVVAMAPVPATWLKSHR